MSSRAPVSAGSKQADANFLDEPRAGRLTIGYSPVADEKIIENPPRFSWLPVLEDGAQYVLRVSTDDKYPQDSTTTYSGILLNFHTPDKPLPAGHYFWSYAIWSPESGKAITDWSQTRSFELDGGLARDTAGHARYSIRKGTQRSSPALAGQGLAHDFSIVDQ